MKLISSLLLLAPCLPFALGQDCVATQYITVTQKVTQTAFTAPQATSPNSGSSSNTGNANAGGSGGGTGNGVGNGASKTITWTGAETIKPVTITETKTISFTQTVPPITITQTITSIPATTTTTSWTSPPSNGTYHWSSSKLKSSTVSLQTTSLLSSSALNSTSTAVPTGSQNSTTSSIPISSVPTSSFNATTSSVPTSSLNATSSRSSTASITPSSSLNATTSSSSSPSATPTICNDSCALGISASPTNCLSTVYPSTVTETFYTTAFPSNTTLSPVVSTETLIDTLSFTDIQTVTTTTTYEVSTILTTTIIDNTLTILSTTGTVVVTASPVQKRLATSTAPVCTNSAQYSSACACAGLSYSTTTLPIPTVTVTALTNGSYTFTNNRTATFQTTTSATTTLTSNVGFLSVSDATETDLATLTTTVDVIATSTATATPAGSGAYCENGSQVNGLSAACPTGPCVTFNLRIEGATDTIYEGPINTGPQDITTPSGGTHLCNGQNNGANPNAAGTGITCLAAAGGLCGFDFDGTFSASFDDFFIERIGGTAQTSNEFWGILENFAYTPTGGCETEPPAGSDLLWAFNAFNANYFLDISPRTATVSAGTIVVFTVTGHDGNGGTAVPVSGASFSGLVSNANGQVAYVATAPGTYRLKATRSDSIRSPGVVITVT